jgi:hypothetical protein
MKRNFSDCFRQASFCLWLVVAFLSGCGRDESSIHWLPFYQIDEVSFSSGRPFQCSDIYWLYEYNSWFIGIRVDDGMGLNAVEIAEIVKLGFDEFGLAKEKENQVVLFPVSESKVAVSCEIRFLIGVEKHDGSELDQKTSYRHVYLVEGKLDGACNLVVDRNPS